MGIDENSSRRRDGAGDVFTALRADLIGADALPLPSLL